MFLNFIWLMIRFLNPNLHKHVWSYSFPCRLSSAALLESEGKCGHVGEGLEGCTQSRKGERVKGVWGFEHAHKGRTVARPGLHLIPVNFCPCWIS